MSFIGRAFQRTESENEVRAKTSGLQNPASWAFDALGGVQTFTGRRVDAASALTYSAVFAAVRLLAETLGSLSLLTYGRLPDGGRRRAVDHPAYPVLRWQANEVQTAMQFRELLQFWTLLRGNGYAAIERDGGGKVVALLPLRPDYMRVFELQGGGVLYSWEPPGMEPAQFQGGSGDILHVAGISSDGLVGLSPITLARESIALGMAAEEYAGRFYSNDASPRGVLTHPNTLDDPAQKRLKNSLKNFRGLTNRHKTMILEEGMKWEQIGISPEDAQMIESRRFQVTEVARWFRVPPHMLGDLENASFSNVEQESQNFVMYSLQPWLVRWEQALSRDVFLEGERSRFFAEHLVETLLRSDLQTRSAHYASAILNGYMSRNEVRALENLNPEPGLDAFLVPLNMAPATTAGGGARSRAVDVELAGQAGGRPLEVRTAHVRKQVGASFVPLFERAALTLLRGEFRELEKAAGRGAESDALDLEAFLAFTEGYYEHDGAFREFAMRTVSPAFLSLAESIEVIAREEVGAEEGDASAGLVEFALALAGSFVTRHAAISKQGLAEALVTNNDRAQLSRVLNGWQADRPASIAKRETNKTRNATARRTFEDAGLKTQWQAVGENCPFCDQLDGEIVGGSSHFRKQGDELVTDDDRAPLVIQTPILHPPLHRGCDCEIVAV